MEDDMETPDFWPWPVDVKNLWKRGGLNAPLFKEMRGQRLSGEVSSAAEFMRAALADGWSLRKTYEQEPAETAFTMERDGFKLLGLARRGDECGPPLPTGSINIWGPDGLAIKTPIKYPGFETIKAGLEHCSACGKYGVKTQRVGFANRVCADCAPELRKTIETPGWCD